jgi:hypothetical protein
MSTERDLLKECLPHLLKIGYTNDSDFRRRNDLLARIGDVLQNPEPDPEPVANTVPLSAPPPQTRKELTDDEIQQIYDGDGVWNLIDFAIELAKRR